jgi:hypothetical protein
MVFFPKLFDAKINGTSHNGNNTPVYRNIRIRPTTTVIWQTLGAKVSGEKKQEREQETQFYHGVMSVIICWVVFCELLICKA